MDMIYWFLALSPIFSLAFWYLWIPKHIRLIISTAFMMLLKSFISPSVRPSEVQTAIRVANSLRIEVEFEGRRGIVFVPYYDELVPRSINSHMIAIDGGKEVNIDQLPGVPFLVTPTLLGVMSVVKVDELNDVTEYTENQQIVI